MTDIEIIKELEKKLPRKLKQLEHITWFSKGYMLNENGEVTHLSIFNVRLNGAFPKEIFMFKNLEYLDIRENGLSAVPDEIKELKNLTYLDIRYNELTELPGGFNGLAKLERLYLGYNSFRSMPENIEGLESLFLIDLTENEISSGTEKLFGLPALTNIYLKTNRLKSIPFDLLLHGRIELNISENQIIVVPAPVYEKIVKII
jgi:Leucine-rich repeat (LRR) protein